MKFGYKPCFDIERGGTSFGRTPRCRCKVDGGGSHTPHVAAVNAYGVGGRSESEVVVENYSNEAVNCRKWKATQ